MPLRMQCKIDALRGSRDGRVPNYTYLSIDGSGALHVLSSHNLVITCCYSVTAILLTKLHSTPEVSHCMRLQ